MKSIMHTLAAIAALGSPMSAGIPPLDTGRREPRVLFGGQPLRDGESVYPPTRTAGGCDLEFRDDVEAGYLVVTIEDRVRASCERQAKAAAKRARRAARRSR